jgi:AmiR/NasT family two-component response regulator
VASTVTVLDPAARGAIWANAARAEVLWRESRALRLLSAESIARARATRDRILRGRARRESLHASAFARLQARMGTMAVIEQAKGIIMARERCGPGEASGLLRRACQRANVKLHEQAAQMIEQIASGKDSGNVTSNWPPATWHQGPRTQARSSGGERPRGATMGDCGPGGPTRLHARSFEAVRRESKALVHSSEQSRARARATRDQIRQGRTQREILQDSAFARLRAKMTTLPVIEQAKGIIMAQQECGPQEAFDLLRRASQRANVKLHVVAARIVAHVASPPAETTVHPTRPPRQRRP